MSDAVNSPCWGDGDLMYEFMVPKYSLTIVQWFDRMWHEEYLQWTDQIIKGGEGETVLGHYDRLPLPPQPPSLIYKPHNAV